MNHLSNSHVKYSGCIWLPLCISWHPLRAASMFQEGGVQRKVTITDNFVCLSRPFLGLSWYQSLVLVQGEGGWVQRPGTKIHIEYLHSPESVMPVNIQSVPVRAQTLGSHDTLGRKCTLYLWKQWHMITRAVKLILQKVTRMIKRRKTATQNSWFLWLWLTSLVTLWTTLLLNCYVITDTSPVSRKSVKICLAGLRVKPPLLCCRVCQIPLGHLRWNQCSRCNGCS